MVEQWWLQKINCTTYNHCLFWMLVYSVKKAKNKSRSHPSIILQKNIQQKSSHSLVALVKERERARLFCVRSRQIFAINFDVSIDWVIKSRNVSRVSWISLMSWTAAAKQISSSFFLMPALTFSIIWLVIFNHLHSSLPVDESSNVVVAPLSPLVSQNFEIFEIFIKASSLTCSEWSREL